MCGIVAYTGKNLCKDLVFEGLSRLEYRGYDSAGFVCIDKHHGQFNFDKEAGGSSPIQRLAEKIHFDGYTGMAHTRWATHGLVDTVNAHPHFNCNKAVAVVHNGIIEGHEVLREQLLARGHHVISTTDSELAAHLFNDEIEQRSDLKEAVMAFVSQIRGAFAFVFMLTQYPDTLVVVRHRSAMVIGVGEDEAFVASDFIAFADKTNNVVFLPDDSFAFVRRDSIELYDFSGRIVPYFVQSLDQKYIEIDKGVFEHFMLKEIYEQKRAISRTIGFCKMLGSPGIDTFPHHYEHWSVATEYNDSIWRQLGLSIEQIKSLRYINLVSAGTSWHAACIAQFFFEMICKIPTRVFLASEFRYMSFFPQEDSVYIMVSQSGETADTLEALRLINSYNVPTIAITNVASSSIVREAGGFLPMQAGPEISVASTKAFSTQLATLFWIANRIALERGTITLEEMYIAEEQLCVAAEVLESTIEMYKFRIIQDLAPKYMHYSHFIFLGRHISYPFAMEASLKLKEISYIFAQCYPAGELKHGPIALVDENTPVVIFSVLDELLYHKLLANASEVKARNGHLVVFAFEGQDELIGIADTAFVIPPVAPLLGPLAMTGLMQFFIYHITRQLGMPIDKPRNLAKSVTVE
ncbi:glutamine--fructose-6-phosphate transaminase (isomerizing) [Candidatus Dependentiae bacterium]|nr:glutamine--fructose-6-phosphate transaminase (isomerizing) [Candidatus Dependentiae bacterium]